MKEAAVFILDGNSSMNEPYPRIKAEDSVAVRDTGTTGEPPPKQKHIATTTRLDCAKLALESMISDLILQSKTNEVCVIVCKTAETRHHKIASGVDYLEEGDDLPFPNLTELTPGLVRPDAELLRRIATIETVAASPSEESTLSKPLQGDICDAIILAADALYERGTKYKFQRKIVLITDAEHEVVMDVQQILTVIDELRAMNCSLHVIGLDFASTSAAVYEEAGAAVKQEDDIAPDSVASSSCSNKKVKRNDTNVTKSETDEAVHENDGNLLKEEEEGDSNEIVYATKQDREKLLLSLTEKTGGSVIAASTLQQVLDANRGKRLQTSVKTKFQFRIAPGLAFEARYSLLMSKHSFPVLKTKSVVLDEATKQPKLDDLGQEITFKVQKADLFVDPDNPDDIVDKEDRTKAIQFGSTLVPLSTFDYEGLKPKEMGARMEILGYVERGSIPLAYMSGPPLILTGHESRQACAGISALAQALHQLEKVAIATFYKRSTSTKALLVVLFPLDEPNCPHPIHLVVLQIPFEGEVKQLNLDSLTDYLTYGDEGLQQQKAQACDELIDSLMLPDAILESGQIPSPMQRSCNQTKIKRAMNSTVPIVRVRPSDSDTMVTPCDILQRSKSTVQAFEAIFSVVERSTATTANTKAKANTGGRKGGRNVLTYKDYL